MVKIYLNKAHGFHCFLRMVVGGPSRIPSRLDLAFPLGFPQHFFPKNPPSLSAASCLKVEGFASTDGPFTIHVQMGKL